jgi:hypothetical protein
VGKLYSHSKDWKKHHYMIVENTQNLQKFQDKILKILKII